MLHLYYISQDGTESNDIEKLLEKYEEGSKHIKVEQRILLFILNLLLSIPQR